MRTEPATQSSWHRPRPTWSNDKDLATLSIFVHGNELMSLYQRWIHINCKCAVSGNVTASKASFGFIRDVDYGDGARPRVRSSVNRDFFVIRRGDSWRSLRRS